MIVILKQLAHNMTWHRPGMVIHDKSHSWVLLSLSEVLNADPNSVPSTCPLWYALQLFPPPQLEEWALPILSQAISYIRS